ncbi:hypothetical protein ABQE48_16505 [Mycolicibacterium thermoresistibile]
MPDLIEAARITAADAYGARGEFLPPVTAATSTKAINRMAYAAFDDAIERIYGIRPDDPKFRGTVYADMDELTAPLLKRRDALKGRETSVS